MKVKTFVYERPQKVTHLYYGKVTGCIEEHIRYKHYIVNGKLNISVLSETLRIVAFNLVRIKPNTYHGIQVNGEHLVVILEPTGAITSLQTSDVSHIILSDECR